MIHHASYVVCDRCGGFPCQVSTEGAHLARRYAKEEGYKRVSKEDICPECQLKPKRKGGY